MRFGVRNIPYHRHKIDRQVWFFSTSEPLSCFHQARPSNTKFCSCCEWEQVRTSLAMLRHNGYLSASLWQYTCSCGQCKCAEWASVIWSVAFPCVWTLDPWGQERFFGSALCRRSYVEFIARHLAHEIALFRTTCPLSWRHLLRRIPHEDLQSILVRYCVPVVRRQTHTHVINVPTAW
jgi:hypothetical protein